MFHIRFDEIWLRSQILLKMTEVLNQLYQVAKTHYLFYTHLLSELQRKLRQVEKYLNLLDLRNCPESVIHIAETDFWLHFEF